MFGIMVYCGIFGEQMFFMKGYTDHNGKEKKASEGTNVRISDKVYKSVKSYCNKEGLRIGKFVEMAVQQRLSRMKANSVISEDLKK